MKIQLNNTEILTALHQYVNTMGINLTNKTISIEFIQGRKNGLSAEIAIDEASDDVVDDVVETETKEPEAHQEREDVPETDGSQSIFG
jgi:hypothetical protein